MLNFYLHLISLCPQCLQIFPVFWLACYLSCFLTINIHSWINEWNTRMGNTCKTYFPLFWGHWCFSEQQALYLNHLSTVHNLISTATLSLFLLSWISESKQISSLIENRPTAWIKLGTRILSLQIFPSFPGCSSSRFIFLKHPNSQNKDGAVADCCKQHIFWQMDYITSCCNWQLTRLNSLPFYKSINAHIENILLWEDSFLRLVVGKLSPEPSLEWSGRIETGFLPQLQHVINFLWISYCSVG